MEIVQVIGAYAGFAAIIGLAILSALYFSQARDVRRLREWAGRAPERTSQQETALAPGSQPASGVRPPTAGQPAGAQPPVSPPAPAGALPAPAAGASPPAPAPGLLTPSAGQAVTASGQPVAAPAGGGAKPAVAAATGANNTISSQASPGPAETSPAPVLATGARAEGAATTAKVGGPPALPGAVPLGAEGSAPPHPAARVAPSAGAGAGRAPQSPAAAPSAVAEREPWYLRLAPRYIVLIVAGALIVGGGVAYALTQRSAGAPPAPRAAEPGATADAGGGGGAAARAPVDRSEVTVSVLNGTTVAGLARRVSDDLRGAGFRKGRTDNATEQARAESVVFYADGSERAARAVGEQLGIGQRQPITGDARALAGNADVVVVLGADKI